MERFYRTKRLLGDRAFSALQSSTVAVIGLGAVGSFAAEALARAGIRRLIIADFDTVSVSNINRQLFALDSTVGKEKTEIAKQRILDINSEISVTLLKSFLSRENLNTVFDHNPDIIVDAIDSVSSKCDLLIGAKEQDVPVVSAMGAALKTDLTKIHTADIMDTHTCGLARQVRSRLRKAGITGGIPVVFSEEEVQFEFLPPEQETYMEAEHREGGKSMMLGSLVTVTGIFGLTLAHLVIEILTQDIEN